MVSIDKLGGKSDFEPVTVAVTQNELTQISGAVPKQKVHFALDDLSSKLFIRVYPK